MKDDSEIHQAVRRELGWDARVDAELLGVSVHHGVVTLTGDVRNWAQRVAAERAVQRVRGVLDVANDLRVHIEAADVRSDQDLAEAVCLALQSNVLVPHAAVRSAVSEGIVTLTGEVDYLAQRDDAEGAIEHLKGLRLVINDIGVKPRAAHPTGDVRQAIHEALGRRTEREYQRIRIDDRDGVVTLSGACHTWAEKNAVLGAAKGTLGVLQVQDQLRVVP